MSTNLKSDRDTVAILGIGRAGSAFGSLLREAGYPVVAVADRTPATALRNVEYTGGKICGSFPEAASMASLVIISTSDDAIEFVCRAISESGSVGAGQKVIHLSGAAGLDLLLSAREKGAGIAAIHPLQTFTDIPTAISRLPGSNFGITTEENENGNWAFQMVRDIGGNPIAIAEKDRPLYHAAACIASNYLVALMHLVENIYRTFGLTAGEALRASWPLVEGTLSNIDAAGTVQALTGPIARGDAGTIRRHIEALRRQYPACLPVYCALGRLSAEIALEKGTLSPEKSTEIKRMLEGESHE